MGGGRAQVWGQVGPRGGTCVPLTFPPTVRPHGQLHILDLSPGFLFQEGHPGVGGSEDWLVAPLSREG